MTQSDLDRFKKWFSGYTRLFFSENPDEQKNIDLKVRHTEEVCALSRRLTEGLTPDKDLSLLAETAALFHDVGRFPQYAKYKTFRDSISINHGMLGAEVLISEGTLQGLPPDEQAVIINAVRFHNALAVPGLKVEKELLILKLVRDSDKLDIWRIFLGFFEPGSGVDVASEAGLGLPDLPGYSGDALESIFHKKTAVLRDLRSLNDFKLMLMSWTYDLNFRASYELLAEKDYINRLALLLPETEGVNKAKALLTAHLADRLGN
ncbi:MAG: HD domain-containing protein [Nitrospirae bacterium]|nr:HD domain-containing protein [Nitrospirota bacterium]